MKKATWAVLAVATFFGPVGANAAPIVITFEGLADSTSLSNQFAGLTFSNAQVLSAGASLNEFDFPPASGSNVATDAGGNLIINFAAPVYTISARITYTESIVMTGYDAALSPLTSVSSLFSANYASLANPASSPNELISITSLTGFSRVRFAGAATGGSFVIDDLTYDTAARAVPEPASLALLALALAGLVRARRLSPAVR